MPPLSSSHESPHLLGTLCVRGDGPAGHLRGEEQLGGWRVVWPTHMGGAIYDFN